MPCIAAAYAIISIVMVLTGTIGARLHVAFPVLNRSSFGFWFSYFTVFSRVILSMFWFGIQVMTATAHCILMMFMNAFSHTMGHNAYIRCIRILLASFGLN
jgi:NCS1 family nucleobase:cation symporter-1